MRAGNAVAVRLDAGEGRHRESFAVVVESRQAGDPEAAGVIGKDVTSRVVSAVGVRPARVVVLAPGSLPKTPSGKLRRAATAELLRGVISPRCRGGTGGPPRPARAELRDSAALAAHACVAAKIASSRTSRRWRAAWCAFAARGDQPESAWKRFCVGSSPSASRASVASAARSTAKSSSLRSVAEKRLSTKSAGSWRPGGRPMPKRTRR